MSETELRIEKKLEKFREGALPHAPEETRTDVLAPPSSPWIKYVHRNRESVVDWRYVKQLS